MKDTLPSAPLALIPGTFEFDAERQLKEDKERALRIKYFLRPGYCNSNSCLLLFRKQREDEQRRALELIAYEPVKYSPVEMKYFTNTATKITNYLLLADFSYVRIALDTTLPLTLASSSRT